MSENQDDYSTSSSPSPNNGGNSFTKNKNLNSESSNSTGKKNKYSQQKNSEKKKPNADVGGKLSSSSSSIFISSLSQNGSFSKKPQSFEKTGKKNKNNKTKQGSKSANGDVSLHSYKIDQIKSTFHTSEDNILKPKHNLNSKKKSTNNKAVFTPVPHGKHLYTDFNGDSIYYSSILKLTNYERLVAMDKKQGKRPFYWPFNDNSPSPIKFEYYVNSGKIPNPINCYFLESEDEGAESINFKNCENKDLSIYFLLRILDADYDLIDRIVSNLSNVAVHILKQIILSILKGWNIYLVCDVDLVRRCVDVFYKLRGFRMYYLNRPVITVVGFQNSLSCKNCYRFGKNLENNDSMDVEMETEQENLVLKEEAEVLSDATTDSDDESDIMDIILDAPYDLGSIEEKDMNDSESFDPKVIALEYLTKLQKNNV